MTSHTAQKVFTLGPQEGLLLERIRRSGRAVTVLRRDRSLFDGFTANPLRQILKQLADDGWLHRIERGVYAVARERGLKTQVPLALLADWLDGEDYVVSGFFALAHWNLTHFPASTIDVFLARRRPNVRYGPTFFRFVYVPRDRLPEYRAVNIVGARASVRMATPERALADALAGRHATSIEIAREAFRRGLRDGVLHRSRLLTAAREAPSAAARRLGWIAEHENDRLTMELRALVGNKGYVPLDPTRDATDTTRNTDWRVLENAAT